LSDKTPNFVFSDQLHALSWRVVMDVNYRQQWWLQGRLEEKLAQGKGLSELECSGWWFQEARPTLFKRQCGQWS
jgi:hypothetical protein